MDKKRFWLAVAMTLALFFLAIISVDQISSFFLLMFVCSIVFSFLAGRIQGEGAGRTALPDGKLFLKCSEYRKDGLVYPTLRRIKDFEDDGYDSEEMFYVLPENTLFDYRGVVLGEIPKKFRVIIRQDLKTKKESYCLVG